MAGWSATEFPSIPDVDTEPFDVKGALLSRSDSGSIFWDKSAPRSYFRGSVYQGGGRLVSESQRHGGTGADLVLTVNPPHITPEERELALENHRDGTWLYAGNWMHGFGHFIVETIPMIWPIVERGPEIQGISAHRFTSRRTFDWQHDFLRRVLGERPVEVVDVEPVSYERLIVGARPYRYQRSISSRARIAWEAVAESMPGSGEGSALKVFLSRTSFVESQPENSWASSRAYGNSRAIDDVFKDHGFTVVFPEQLSIEEQVVIARDAHYLAGAGGSALHLAAFSRGARVIEVGDKRSGDRLVSSQRAIAAVKHQQIAQIPFVESGDGELDVDHAHRELKVLGV